MAQRTMNKHSYIHLLHTRIIHTSSAVLVCLLLIICSLTSCRTQKTATQRSHKANIKQEFVQQVIVAQPLFETAEASRVRVGITYAGNPMTVNGSISVVTDSIIVLSAQPLLGIEMFRVEITPANLLVIDRLNRKYVQMTYAELKDLIRLPLTFQDLQAVFLNRMFVIGKEQSELDQFDYIHVMTEAQHDQLIFHDKNLTYWFDILNTNNALIRTQVTLKQATAHVEYVNHQLQDNVYFPTTLIFSINNGKSDIIKCDFSLLKVRFNQPVNIRTTDLSRYTQTTIKQLLSE